jgi:hypothetical protein
MLYALDQHRRMLNGEELTAVDQEWAALGATLSPAKVLGWQGGGAQEDEEDYNANDEFEDFLSAILEQYECDEEEAAEALEETVDEAGWNLDAAIDMLLAHGVQPYKATGGSGKYDDASGDSVHNVSGTDSDDGGEGGIQGGGRGDMRARTEGGGGDPKADQKKLNAGSVLPPPVSKIQSHSGASAGTIQIPLLRHRSRSTGPEIESRRGDGDNLSGESAPASSRISAAGTQFRPSCELLVRQVRRAIECDDATARLLLMDKRARDTNGAPDAAKAVKLFFAGQGEGQIKKGNQTEMVQTMSQVKSSAGTLHSMVLPAITLPDWDVGKAPEGGFTYSTFRRIFALLQKYQRQTNFATTVTLKSLVTANLRPTIEARCGLSKYCWKDENDGGMSDEAFIKKIKETLKPVRAMEFEVIFEGMRLKHPGNETDILATVEEWGEKWLSTEREAEEQGILLQPGKMKELFKKAVQPISRVSRLILGEQFKSTAEWYTLIVQELRLRQSYAAEADRDGKKGPPRSWGDGGNRGHESSRGRGRFFGSRQPHHAGLDSQEDRGGAQFNNHSGGAEPMVYSPPVRGRGRGGFSPRGRGGSQWAGRGERGTERTPTDSGRGDGAGSSRNAEQWGNRQPINDPANESSLTKGKWWHDSTNPHLCCRDAECGTRQDIPFCQGCGQHHHSREWCYKKRDEGFNAQGYWSENRKGQAPLPSRTGRAYGTPPARLNHMDAGGGQNPPSHAGQGLA